MYKKILISCLFVLPLLCACGGGAKKPDAPLSERRIPELIATVVCVALHLWRRNPLLSIIISTIIYMIMLQFVFV